MKDPENLKSRRSGSGFEKLEKISSTKSRKSRGWVFYVHFYHRDFLKSPGIWDFSSIGSLSPGFGIFESQDFNPRDFREIPGFAIFYLRDIPGFLAPGSGFLFMDGISRKMLSLVTLNDLIKCFYFSWKNNFLHQI